MTFPGRCLSVAFFSTSPIIKKKKLMTQKNSLQPKVSKQIARKTDRMKANQFLPASECVEPFAKCLNGVQCVSRLNFCDKTDRGMMQYHCSDNSDESVWGCAKVGKDCAGDLEDYWPCSRSNASAQCIHANKVCDGSTGLESNDCESGEDEEPEFCRDVLGPDLGGLHFVQWLSLQSFASFLCLYFRASYAFREGNAM